MSQSAERSLVAFLTKADSDNDEKLSPAQIALGKELRAAHKGASKHAAAKPVSAHKAAAAGQVRGLCSRRESSAE